MSIVIVLYFTKDMYKKYRTELRTSKQNKYKLLNRSKTEPVNTRFVIQLMINKPVCLSENVLNGAYAHKHTQN